MVVIVKRRCFVIRRGYARDEVRYYIRVVFCCFVCGIRLCFEFVYGVKLILRDVVVRVFFFYYSF